MNDVRKPVHPGRVFFKYVLDPQGLTITDAADMMGIARNALSEFVNEKSSCSPQMVLKIAMITRTNAETWLAMQAKLDLWEARQQELARVSEASQNVQQPLFVD